MNTVQTESNPHLKNWRMEMHTINGYIDNNVVVVNENISSYDGCDVIITILDRTNTSESVMQSDDEMKKAAKSIAGLWKSHDNKKTVDDEVRSMRKGRNFDF